MVMWIVYGALVFSTVYSGLGAVDLIRHAIAGLNLSPWGILIMMQLSYFVLGCILDDTAIIFICLPLYIPIAAGLGFDLVWFGILFIVNLQMAFLTPPVGYNLFYMRGVVPMVAPDITLADIYRSAWPFVLLQGAGLALTMVFPQLALWLPNLIFAK
jgi:TRAP-type mannitol/chloroaromatic compound transport system permease large subunit